MKKRYHRFLFITMACIVTVSLSKGAIAQKALAFGVYSTNSETNCTSSPASSCEDYRNRFWEGAIDEWGWSSSSVLRKSNQNVNWSDFADMYHNGAHWGRDYQEEVGADWADITFLATHGASVVNGCSSKNFAYPSCSSTSSCTGLSYTEFEMGSSGSRDLRCDLRTTDMALNGGYSPVGGAGYNADIFMTRACNSAVPCVWQNGGYDSLGRQGFRMYNGFYGPHRSNTDDKENFSLYMKSVKNDGIGSQWLAIMDTPRNDGVGQNCPVSFVYCENTSKCDLMYNWGGANDIKDTGTQKMTKMYWISGCNPSRPGNTYPVLP